MLQNRGLAARQTQGDTFDIYISPNRIKNYISGFECGSKRASRATQQGFCPRYELVHCKRLHEVIVRSSIKTTNAIIDRIARGQNQNWDSIAGRSQFGKQPQPIPIWETQ